MMNTSNQANKPHAICIPFPAQSHVTPMMHLAKLLHSKGFYITFVNTEFNHNRLIRAKDSQAWVNDFPNFKFETMPDGLPPSDRDATQSPPLICHAMRENSLPSVREVLARVRAMEGIPKISCVVCDGMMSGGVRAAREIGVRGVQLWTASACGFLGYLQYPQLLSRGIIPFKDESFKHDGTLDTPLDDEWIPTSMKNMKLQDLPSFMRTTNADDILFNYLKDEAQNCLQASSIIFNTFDALEPQALQDIKSIFPQIYTIGPLNQLQEKHVPDSPLSSFRPTLWKEDIHCLEWLAQREPKSVIYVNYGCITLMSQENLLEFAWGLANSKHQFLWILRPDVVMGDSGTMMPQEFIDETRERGLVASWCPQQQVVVHPAIGAFLTHCGWNSLLEGVCGGGLPVICWPFFAEQCTNCWYACRDDKWGVGLKVDHEVKRKEIEDLVREVMDGNELGAKLRERALDWQKKADVATNVGGSSFEEFENFLKDYSSFLDY